jgi:hypothetical protein
MRTATLRAWMTLAAAATLCFTLNALRKQGSLAPKRSENEDVSSSATGEAADLPYEAPDAETSPETPQQPAEPELLQRPYRWVPAAVVTTILVVAVAAVWVATTR